LLASKGGKDDEDERTVSSVLVAATAVSVVAAIILLAIHKPALAMYIGPTNSMIVPYAATYSVIRLVALPVGIATAVAQSAFLAVRDPWTPLKAVALTTVTNFVLDVWFVAGLKWGIGGAAAATSLSQIITLVLLIQALVKRGPEIDKVKKIVAESASRSGVTSGQSFRKVRNIGAPALRLPFKKPRDNFFRRMQTTAGPVMVVALIKCIFVGWIVRTATSISPAASAANGVLFTVYFFFAVVGEGVSQAAQTFLPAQLGNFEKSSKLAFRIMFVAVLIGIFNASISGFVPIVFPNLFTKSAEVTALIQAAAPFMGLALLAHTASMASEGCLLACRDGIFMSLSYVPNAALSCVTLSILYAQGLGVRASWLALFQFHCFRLAINAVRLRRADSPLRTSLATQPRPEPAR
jgi:Na+-driven multidrug efflux pump